MSKPVLLDLFCGAGGCTKGYQEAGFFVIGIDINRQPHYCGDEFLQADAMEYLAWAQAVVTTRTDPLAPWTDETVEELMRSPFYCPSLDPDDIDFIHASPPCQAYTKAGQYMRARGTVYPDLLPVVRERLTAIGVPWVIENVPGAPMRPDFRICACQVGLKHLRRERWFETWTEIPHLDHPHDHHGHVISVVGHGTPTWVRGKLGRCPTADECRDAMGIDWMNRDELSQAIPPAYTRLIGGHLMKYLDTSPMCRKATR